jgi:hypothetical protein
MHSTRILRLGVHLNNDQNLNRPLQDLHHDPAHYIRRPHLKILWAAERFLFLLCEAFVVIFHLLSFASSTVNATHQGLTPNITCM